MYHYSKSSFYHPNRNTARARFGGDAPGLLAGLLRHWKQARQRRVDDEIGRLIEERGGKFTDSLERLVEHRFFR